MLNSSPSKTVMYPAVANLAVLRRELVAIVGTMWTSLAGCQRSWCSWWRSLAGVRVPLGS